MNGELIVLIGLPGSGKTEYAKRLIFAAESNGRKMYRVNWDELRKDLSHTGVFDRKREDAMKKISVQNTEIAINHGAFQDVVVDNTNLSESTRNMWRGVAQRLNLEYFEVGLNISTENCIRQDSQREGLAQVGRAVIERMALFANRIKFPAFVERGNLIVISGPPREIEKNIVLCDIDGTLSDLTERQAIIAPQACPRCDGLKVEYKADSGKQIKCKSCYGSGNKSKDWYNFYKRVSQDKPRQSIIDLINKFYRDGYIVCLTSGRPIKWAELETGKETVQWLKDVGVSYDHIFMRQSGDKRPDTEVKQEILNQLPKERIAYVFDDRDSVVKMWRSNGLTCLQVAEGNF